MRSVTFALEAISLHHLVLRVDKGGEWPRALPRYCDHHLPQRTPSGFIKTGRHGKAPDQ
jgi:hypothetical protein